jgi:hypothetical protein
VGEMKKTNASTVWTGKGHDSLDKVGQDGNTKYTRLPMHGRPKGAKKGKGYK